MGSDFSSHLRLTQPGQIPRPDEKTVDRLFLWRNHHHPSILRSKSGVDPQNADRQQLEQESGEIREENSDALQGCGGLSCNLAPQLQPANLRFCLAIDHLDIPGPLHPGGLSR